MQAIPDGEAHFRKLPLDARLFRQISQESHVIARPGLAEETG
jgi:hypothetical protein